MNSAEPDNQFQPLSDCDALLRPDVADLRHWDFDAAGSGDGRPDGNRHAGGLDPGTGPVDSNTDADLQFRSGAGVTPRQNAGRC